MNGRPVAVFDPELMKLRRNLRHLTRVELAAISGLSYNLIYRIETGSRRPGPETIQKLARALHCDSWDLMATALPEAEAV